MSETTPSVSQEIVAESISNLRPWYDLWDYRLLSILHRKEIKNQDMFTVQYRYCSSRENKRTG